MSITPKHFHLNPKNINVYEIKKGTKGDLYPKDAYSEADNIQEIISEADCNQLRDQIEAAVFVECSAKTNCNLKPIFKEAVKAVLLNEKRQKVKNNFLSRSQPSLFRFQ